jgi:hypothetical protein
MLQHAIKIGRAQGTSFRGAAKSFRRG